jgi:lipopolysaccharide cholinephosphotransferase
MKTIKIDGADFAYEEIDLNWDNTIQIDPEIARNNLLVFKRILDARKINFVLVYGTLLGAVRDKGFIEHDYDIDTTLFDQEAFLRIIPELKSAGLLLVRFCEKQMTYSFMKDNCYIDVYIPTPMKGLLGLVYVNYCGRFFPRHFFKSFTTISFLNEEFVVPAKPERLLRYFYGSDWQTPIREKPGIIEPLWLRNTKRFFGILLPITMVQKIKKILYKSSA